MKNKKSYVYIGLPVLGMIFLSGIYQALRH